MEPERKARLGQKWVCYSCGGRFYDLGKEHPICPKCEADQRESPAFEKPTRKRTKKKTVAKKKTAKRKKKVSLPPLDDDEALVTKSDEGETQELDPTALKTSGAGAVDDD